MVDDSNEKDRTLYCGNLHDDVTEEILYELFLQAGPLQKVKIATAPGGGQRKGYSFITFKHAASVPFTIQLMDGIRLFGKPLRLQVRSGSIHESQQNGRAQLPNMPTGSGMMNASPSGVPNQFHRSFSAPVMSPNHTQQLQQVAMGLQQMAGQVPWGGAAIQSDPLHLSQLPMQNINGMRGSPGQSPHHTMHPEVGRLRMEDRGHRDSSASGSSTPEYQPEPRWRSRDEYDTPRQRHDASYSRDSRDRHMNDSYPRDNRDRQQGTDRYRGDRERDMRMRDNQPSRNRSFQEYSSPDTGSDSSRGHRGSRDYQQPRHDRRRHQPY